MRLIVRENVQNAIDFFTRERVTDFAVIEMNNPSVNKDMKDEQACAKLAGVITQSMEVLPANCLVLVSLPSELEKAEPLFDLLASSKREIWLFKNEPKADLKA